jgi:hypothetical protein
MDNRNSTACTAAPEIRAAQCAGIVSPKLGGGSLVALLPFSRADFQRHPKHARRRECPFSGQLSNEKCFLKLSSGAGLFCTVTWKTELKSFSETSHYLTAACTHCACKQASRLTSSSYWGTG